MAQKARANLKMMTKIAIGISLAVNVIIVPIAWVPTAVGSPWQLLFFFFKLPFVAMILTIVLSFGAMLGEPVFKTPDIIIKDTIEAIHDGYTKYSNPSGLFGLRESIVDKFKVDNNIITTAHYKNLGPWMKKTLEIVKSKK